ncbi:MAG TPA: ACT domain-containing protein [Planctomycetaceae bacterium]|nr:ACT domain-containing protein [Planctomycetaceae bacterium]
MDSLCRSCLNVREVVSGAGSTFLLCKLSQTETSFPKYPPQPVTQCDGYWDRAHGRSSFKLIILSNLYAVCRLDKEAAVPEWAQGELVSISRTPDELSIICLQGDVPVDIRKETGWRCLQIAGPLDFSIVGVIATLTGTLAAADISVFAVSTFDTDYLLVKQQDLDATVKSLTIAGHQIVV